MFVLPFWNSFRDEISPLFVIWFKGTDAARQEGILNSLPVRSKQLFHFFLFYFRFTVIWILSPDIFSNSTIHAIQILRWLFSVYIHALYIDLTGSAIQQLCYGKPVQIINASFKPLTPRPTSLVLNIQIIFFLNALYPQNQQKKLSIMGVGDTQSHKNPVSASAMLTGKFLQIRKVFATSSLLAEEFPDTLQYKISR